MLPSNLSPSNDSDDTNDHHPSCHANLIPISPTGCNGAGNLNSIVWNNQNDDVVTSPSSLQPCIPVITPEKKQALTEPCVVVVDVDVRALQFELQETRKREQQAVEALQHLQEAVRIVTRQLKEQPRPVVLQEEADEGSEDEVAILPLAVTVGHCNRDTEDVKHIPTCSEEHEPGTVAALPCWNKTITTTTTPPLPLPSSSSSSSSQHYNLPPNCIYGNRHRTWSAGTATSNLSSAAKTTTTSSTHASSTVRSFCTDDELRLAQLLCLSSSQPVTLSPPSSSSTESSSSSPSPLSSSLPPDVAADVMNLVNTAHMIRDLAKWTTMDNASLLEEMQHLQDQCHDAVQRAHDLEQTCTWYQTHVPILCQQLLRYKRERTSLKQRVKHYQREVRLGQEELRKCALEQYVLQALHVHEQQLSLLHKQKQQQQQQGENGDHVDRLSSKDKQEGFDMVHDGKDEEDIDNNTNSSDNEDNNNNSVAGSALTASVMFSDGLATISKQTTMDEDEEVAIKKEDELVFINYREEYHRHNQRDSVETLVTKNTSSMDDDNEDDVKVHATVTLPPILSATVPETTKVQEKKKMPPAATTTTAVPRGLGFGAAGALGFGSFQLHKSWGGGAPTTTVKPPLRPTMMGGAKHGVATKPTPMKNGAESKNTTANLKESGTIENKAPGASNHKDNDLPKHKSQTTDRVAVAATEQKSLAAAEANNTATAADSSKAEEGTLSAHDDRDESARKPRPSFGYEPIKLLDRRISSSPLSWMSTSSSTPRDGAEHDLGTKMMKFFQSRGGNNNNNKSEDTSKPSSQVQPRLHLVDDDDCDEVDDADNDDQQEDPSAHTCSSTVSMNASLSPQQCTDHFVHCICDHKKLSMPQTPQTPFSNRGFVPLTHVTCSTDDSSLPTSTLASPKESPALPEGYTFRNPFVSIRCDQNVLRSLAIPATEARTNVGRVSSFTTFALVDKLPSTRSRLRQDQEDQNGECGRLYEC